MAHFLSSWLDWGWAWMLIGLTGNIVIVAVWNTNSDGE
jgi:hypothetical protein